MTACLTDVEAIEHAHNVGALIRDDLARLQVEVPLHPCAHPTVPFGFRIHLEVVGAPTLVQNKRSLSEGAVAQMSCVRPPATR